MYNSRVSYRLSDSRDIMQGPKDMHRMLRFGRLESRLTQVCQVSEPGHTIGFYTPCNNMAAVKGANNSGDTEMKIETNVLSLDLSEFISRCVFPEIVCVTDGNYLSKEVQISPGDVLLLKSCNKGHVVLSYRDESSHKWTEVNVDLDYPQKFKVLPPKDTTADSRTASVVMYPTISDLILDCPTFFEATTRYDDANLPDMSVKSGDQFWFVGMAQHPESGEERLKVYDGKGNVRFLSLDCRGNFYHLTDDKEYSVRELVELAPVQRRLKIVIKQLTKETTNDCTKNIFESEHSKDEYAVVNKTASKSKGSVSKTSSRSSQHNSLPESFSGIVHLRKYESTVAVSPYNDLEITWEIPLSANLKIRSYSQSDYEVPAPWKPSIPQVPLPLSPNEDVPKFRAPIVPQQPLVPLNISNFVDIYCSTFPVKANIVDTAEAHPFYQEMLKGIDEVIVYRLEEVRRLYVKDAKSDNVYSLSHDLTLSFVEYPEKFQKASDLLHLPVGTEVTVLEDIAADFPKPFSLRFGDIIRLLSNTPYFVKMKNATRDWQVLKCERLDPDGGENTKLKLPMDFEVNMVMAVDPNARRMISLQDLLSGAVPIPNQTVASVLDVSENADLKELPVDLRILRSMKETCIVAASATSKQFPSRFIPKASNVSRSSCLAKESAAVSCSGHEPMLLTNIGLPVTSGIILAFKERLELEELDVVESEADYMRLPLEKITLSQFEERERLRKLNSDYEDIEFGSNSTIDECGGVGGSITRSGSLGVIDKKKSTKMDKMLRFSRALNPKHWRHSKSEPEPLPHPSAMGLMALAAREKDDASNDYHQAHMDSASSISQSLKREYSASGVSIASSDDEEENFYEDVEIGPIKSSTIDSSASRQTGAFSGPSHRSLPPRMPSKLLSRHSDFARVTTDNTAPFPATQGATNISTDIETDVFDSNLYDVPSPLTKARNWATNIGNTIGDRFSSKPRYDVPKNSRVQSSPPENKKTPVTNRHSMSIDRRPPDIKPPLPPVFPTDSNPPIPPSRRKRGKTTQQNSDAKTDENSKNEQSLVTSVSLDDLVSSDSNGVPTPKPKPRGMKKPESPAEASLETQTSLNVSDIVKGVETVSVSQHASAASSSCVPSKDNLRPKPPPKPKMSIHTTV